MKIKGLAWSSGLYVEISNDINFNSFRTINTFDKKSEIGYLESMEKYRKFADPATGINPFLIQNPKTSGLTVALKFVSADDLDFAP